MGRPRRGTRHAGALAHRVPATVVFAVADTVTVLRDGRSVARAHPLSGLHPGGDRPPDGRARARRTPALGEAPVLTEIALRWTARGRHRVGPPRFRWPYALVILGCTGWGGGRPQRTGPRRARLHQVTAGTIEVHGRLDLHHQRRPGPAPPPHRLRQREPQGGGRLPPAAADPNIAVTVWNRPSCGARSRDRDERELMPRYQDRLGIRLSGPAQLAASSPAATSSFQLSRPNGSPRTATSSSSTSPPSASTSAPRPLPRAGSSTLCPPRPGDPADLLRPCPRWSPSPTASWSCATTGSPARSSTTGTTTTRPAGPSDATPRDRGSAELGRAGQRSWADGSRTYRPGS